MKNILKVLFLFSIIMTFVLLISINYSQPNLDYFNDYAVFYPQHQDDELLWGGSAIIRALEECGEDRVYVVLVSDGAGVNVFNNHKFDNLSLKEKVQLRNNELNNALTSLGVKKENVIILGDYEDTLKAHYGLMKKVALYFENKFKSVTHIAHSYICDSHPMHIKNGEIMKNLYSEGKVKDVRYYVKPEFKNKIDSRYLEFFKVKNTTEYNKVINACMEYKIINEKNGQYGIGYISSPNYFKHLMRDSNLTSILHKHI